MKIAVRGSENQFNELKARISSEHELFSFKNTQSDEFDLLFDLEFDQYPQRIEEYAEFEGKTLVLAAVKVQLEAVIAEFSVQLKSKLIGFNALPTFIDRDLAELSFGDADENKELFASLGWDSRTVESRVGLVTPRIIFMIINEAYFTVQEGTANKKDIDLGMKLGTAYPKGPFQWCEEVGVHHVYETLLAIFEDTGDERYKICPMLKTEYLKAMASA
jgi:3-hydroxybutyryl-CoA dehydrogenase